MRTLASNPADSDFAVLARHQLHHRRPLQCLKLFQFASFDFFGQIAGRSYDSFRNLWINMKDAFTLHCSHSKKIRLDFRTSDLVGLDGGLHGRPRPRQGRLCPSRLMAGSIGQKGYNISYIFYLERRNRISRPYFFCVSFLCRLIGFPIFAKSKSDAQFCSHSLFCLNVAPHSSRRSFPQLPGKVRSKWDRVCT